jgi:hypothetical protein
MMDKAIDFNILLFVGSMPFSVQRLIVGIPMPLFACGVAYGMLFVNSFNDGLFKEIGGAMFGVFFLVIIILIFVALWNDTDTTKDDDDGENDSDSDDGSDSSGDDEEAQRDTQVPLSPTAILSRENEKKKIVRRDTVEEDAMEKALADSSAAIEVRPKNKAKGKSGEAVVVKPRGTVNAHSGAMTGSFNGDDLAPISKEDEDDDEEEVDEEINGATALEVTTLPVIGEEDEDEDEEDEDDKEGVRAPVTVAAVPNGADGLPVELKEGSSPNLTVDAELSLSPLGSPTPSITSSTSRPTKETNAPTAKAPTAKGSMDNNISSKTAAQAARVQPASDKKVSPKPEVPKAGPPKKRRTVAMKRTTGRKKTVGGRRTMKRG